MKPLTQIATENYSDYTAKDLEVMGQVRDETVADLKERLWAKGLDTGKIAEVVAEFRRENQ